MSDLNDICGCLDMRRILIICSFRVDVDDLEDIFKFCLLKEIIV